MGHRTDAIFVLFMLKQAKKSTLWNPKSKNFSEIGAGLILFSYIVWGSTGICMEMQRLFNFACAGAFLLLGGALSANVASSGPEVTISCDNGECTSSVTTSKKSWYMTIDCGGGNTWEGGGSGAWGGSLCGASVTFE